MMNLKFDRYFTRKMQGHPIYSPVTLFYKMAPSKQLFTQYFNNDFNTVHKNVILASANPTITHSISQYYDCIPEEQWITIPKHLSEVLRMDLVVLMNTYCDIRTEEQHWEVAYIPHSSN